MGAERTRNSRRCSLRGTCLGLLLACLFSPFARADQPTPSTLIGAVRKGDVAGVRALILQGDNVNAVDIQGMTAMHYAAYRGDSEMAQVLLKAGALPTARDLDGISPLEAAAFDGKTEVARLLIGSGAEVNAADSTGLTALHVAAAGGHEDLVRLLLASGADRSLRSARGRTAAELATQAHADSCAALLHGANPSAKEEKGPAAAGRPEPPRQARIVVTDDNLVHVDTPDSFTPDLPPEPAPTAAVSGANGRPEQKAVRAQGGQTAGKPAPMAPPPMDPSARAAIARDIQARQVALLARIRQLREDCQNHQRFNQALDSNQPIPADLKDMAEKYGSGSPSRDFEGKVNGSDLKEAQMYSRQQANRNKADTRSACDGLKRAEQELRELDRARASLR